MIAEPSRLLARNVQRAANGAREKVGSEKETNHPQSGWHEEGPRRVWNVEKVPLGLASEEIR